MTLGCASALLVLGVVLVGKTLGCPAPVELSGRVETCMQPLSEPLDHTVMGMLRSTTWRESCRVYEESLDCVSDLEAQCQSQPYELEVTGSTLGVLRNGFGKICEDKKTRDRYMKYAPCYASQSKKTRQCLEEFSQRVGQISMGNDEDMESYDDNPMCGAFQEMVRCVNKAVEDCGRDATSILDSLVKAQVPQQITTMCQDSVAEPTPAPNYTPDSTGSAASTTPAISVLLAIAFYFL